ncbi:MAG TPA: transcription-repair coupling factor [Actinomycetota bacterium]|jgi:transcription-repair coupling factor (superfamily II helicase)|nr:transcription-repair coupling factor [Actinomycetota bacterium]
MTAPLRHLLERWEADPVFRDVLHGGGEGVAVPDAVRPYFCGGLAHVLDRCVLVVVPTEAQAEALRAAADEFVQPTALLAAWDVLPYEGLSPDPRISAHRLEALRLLAHGAGPRVVVASARGFIQKPAPGSADLEPRNVRVGESVDRDDLARGLVELGYVREDVAADPGTFAVRGGIVDVFPAQSDRVARIELFGDEVESIRLVDPATQRSVGDATGVVMVARTELPPSALVRERAGSAAVLTRDRAYLNDITDRLERLADGAVPEGSESLLPRLWDPARDDLGSLLPEECTVLILDPLRVADEAARAVEQEEELAALWADPDRVARDITDRPARHREEEGVLHLPLERVVSDIRASGRDVWRTEAFAPAPSSPVIDAHAWEPMSPRTLLERCRVLRADGFDLVFCALPREAAAVRARLTEEELGGADVVASQLHGGFISAPLRLAVVTHTEWHARPPAPARPKRQKRPAALGELRPGDAVVHTHHGIGRYVGMETREVAGFVREYLLIEYAAGDRLFVPTDTTESLQRYIGSDEPALSRLGSGDWERAKARVRKRVRDIAADLIRLYSARLHSKGHSFPLDTPWERELAESFPFDETPDQLRAIDEVGRDMNREIPMDRLVCGDVGFGKTEIAVRAAFKAVVEGKQVAVLVPTTLLAQQHHATFSERFRPFPVKVGMMSRFIDAGEQQEVVAELATGEMDVVVGTHRLLSSDIKFKDLGLLVIDEEHRFGVAQKELLRKMRVDVDVLTLTATPIPRTLEMSLSNIRDLSLIDTAPADRRPVRTFVGPFDERLLAAAIRRELGRGGQVFVVHNRVQSIGRELRRLERLVPEARVAIGHGQMDEDRLERTMLDFWDRKIDVLLCTTIIEAGLDIPTVNTLIVDRADRLGLAQLYQLRGRVGRAGEQAYAYLFFPSNLRLTPAAHERLKTLAQYTELGSGMAIAMRDLEIRGAGNLLGAEQHGHIEAVGFEMYVRLLEEAAKELRGMKSAELPEVRIDLPVDAYLPTSYIDREPLRLAAYRRIAETVMTSDVDDATEELRDRYGPLPAPARTLLEVARLRADAREIGITDISVAPHELHGRVAKLRPIHVDAEIGGRIKALHPRAVVSEATETLLLPLGPPAVDENIVEWLRETVIPLFSRDRVPAEP